MFDRLHVMRRRERYILSALTIVIVLLTAAVGCESADQATSQGVPKQLRVGVVPNISPDKQRAQYQPLQGYLADRLDVDVELFVADNYAGVVAALVAGQVDVAYLGGLTYVQAEAQSKGVVPLVTEVDQETGTPRYLSAIVVPDKSAPRSIEEVVAAGESFAFGDVSSTSGSLYPRMMLTSAGARCDKGDLNTCPPLKTVTFTGGHDATAQAVLNGAAAAGGIELRILHKLEKQGTIPKGLLRVVGQREVMGYPWVARAGLSNQARTAVTEAFTAIGDGKLLDLLRAKSFVKVSAADYDDVRSNASALGLLTPA